MLNDSPRPELRIISIVEALTITGPLKPLLVFSALVRNGLSGCPRIAHALITTRRGSRKRDPKNDELYTAATAAGLEYLTIYERWRFDWRVIPQMYRLILERQPDIVETHDCKSHTLFLILRLMYLRARSPKWLAFHHGYTRTSLTVRLYQLLDYLTLRWADGVVTLCKPFGKALLRRGVRPSKLSIISNTVAARPAPSRALLSECRRQFAIDASERLIVTVGRLSEEKGQADLISAFRYLRTRASDLPLRLLIVGDGPERSRLQGMAEPLGRAVTFTGHLSDPWPLFHAADIFVLPSHSEGSPLVLLEAMAARATIVATSVGGVPEILRNEIDAILIPPAKPEIMANALGLLLGDAALRHRLADAAYSTLERHSPETYARRLITIHGALCGLIDLPQNT